MKPDFRRRLAPRLAAAALLAVTCSSVTGWIYTARELNSLAAYQPAGVEALRLLDEEDRSAGDTRFARQPAYSARIPSSLAIRAASASASAFDASRPIRTK